MKSKAWAPGHSTLFFSVPNKFDDPQLMGSFGGGFNFECGVITEVEKNNKDMVFWNKKLIEGEVTKTTIKLLKKKFPVSDFFKVSHLSELLIGYGLSTSGAGALGTLIAINNLLNLNIEYSELFELAHEAEIIHHTGLGSVVGQITSGIELRKSQGGPNNCQLSNFASNQEIIIVLLGALKTSNVITSEDKMLAVTKAGLMIMKKTETITSDFAERFIKLGEEFTETCGLATIRVKQVINDLLKIGEDRVAMAMIGETIIILPNNSKKLLEWLKDNKYQYIKTRITTKKPQIV